MEKVASNRGSIPLSTSINRVREKVTLFLYNITINK